MENNMMDYDMYGNGVLYDISPSYGGASEYNVFVKNFAKKNDLTIPQASHTIKVKGLWKGKGKKTKAKTTIKRTRKTKATVGGMPKTTTKKSMYGYPKKIPTKKQLDNLGITRKEFEEAFGKLPKRRAQRVGYMYQTRDKRARCLYPNNNGQYFLDASYNCIDNPFEIPVIKPIKKQKKKTKK